MKTKQVIALLQKADPEGELEVCCGNVDISYIGRDPAYWDGTLQVLVRNEKGRVIGGKYKREGHKVQIHLLPFSTLLWDNEKAVMDYSELDEGRQKEYKENHENIRKAAMACDHELEFEHFSKHIKERALKLMDDEGDLDNVIKDFFTENISPYDKIPDDIPFIGLSYLDRRDIQWNREINVSFVPDEGFVLTKENDK
jgi:hypothetical protein